MNIKSRKQVMHTRHLIKQIQKHLTDELLTSKWREIAQHKQTPYCGHCYHATETLYWLLGPESGYKPRVLRHEGGTHWFLENALGEILDPTAEQFTSVVPYHKARGCGFLTKAPSARAQTLIKKVSNEI